ncbi:MAG: HAMP domain-containing protein [Rhodocyclales bacterium GT-UBC]|nr:MAG: HAMP domain-containing protein [Rhodocyclales bacterium GT-UBC]
MNLGRWQPRSLYGRNLLRIVALILCAEIAVALGFHLFIQVPRIERMAELSGNYLQVLSAAIERQPALERQAFARQLAAQDGTVRLQPQRPASLTVPDRLLTRLALQRLQARLGETYRLAWSEAPHRRLWIETRIGGESWWLGLDAQPLDAPRLTLVLVIVLISSVLAALGAWLIQRSLHRPLKALEQAAAGLAEGRFPSFRIADAPSEIAHLATAFERMARQLEASERERNIMLAGISHDLRTPLAKLRLAVEILDAGGDEALRQGMVRHIAAADQIIDQFIDFARLGNAESPSLCHPEELLRDVVAGQASPRLRIAPEDANLPLLLCRPVALRRAIANLLDNALKYSQDEVSIVLAGRADELQLRIIDRGPGIPPDAQPRLRQPFTRLAQARSGPSGAGLGLAIVDRIMALEGGRLSLLNRPHGGLEAILHLPAVDPDRALPAEA